MEVKTKQKKTTLTPKMLGSSKMLDYSKSA